MNQQIVDGEITLIPFYPNSDVALKWYQDLSVCKQVDNIDHAYSLETLNAMYSFLNTHGDLYYIEYRGELVGDIALRDNREICIVICKEYQNLHIGRRCVKKILSLAREKGYSEVFAHIYPFNAQSQKMFTSLGFQKTADEKRAHSWEFKLNNL